jgi:hypothetical protein
MSPWQRVVLAQFLTVALVSAYAQEKAIRREDLPSGVEKTVAEQSKGATIRGFSREKENGKTFYEAELMVNGHSKDVLMDVNGSVVEVEEQVSIASLPTAVRRGLQEKAGSGKLVKVEKLTKKDKLVAYEAKVAASGKTSEVQVGPDGNTLNHEE